MASGKYEPTKLTSVYLLDDWQSAFHDVESRKVVKAIITPKDAASLDQVK